MKVQSWLILAVISNVLPATANAELERTVYAWDTRTTDQGAVQIVQWNGYSTWDSANTDGHDFDASLSVSYGIEDNWSVAIGTSYYQWDWGRRGSDSGLSDFTLRTIYRFQDEAESGLDLAIKGSLGVPTGDEDKGLGSGNWEPQIELLAAKSLGQAIMVGNLGIRNIINTDAGEKDFTGSADLECIYPMSERLSASAFLSGWTSRWDSSQDDAYLDVGAGLRFAPNDTLSFSGSASNTVTSDIYEWYFSLVMAVEF